MTRKYLKYDVKADIFQVWGGGGDLTGDTAICLNWNRNISGMNFPSKPAMLSPPSITEDLMNASLIFTVFYKILHLTMGLIKQHRYANRKMPWKLILNTPKELEFQVLLMSQLQQLGDNTLCGWQPFYRLQLALNQLSNYDGAIDIARIYGTWN